MSARPAFANNPTRARTTFAPGFSSPWSHLMPASTPFQSKPRVRNRPRIDLTTLKIEKDVPPPEGRNIIGKYNDYFSQMAPKDAIKCKPDEVSPIANALRKWIKDKKKDGEFTVLSQKNCDDDLSIGRVWLWPKGESLDGTQHARAAKASAVARNARSSRK
ncbi:MAG: hypothetical protein LCH79_16540 [Proteobacteria bacterium]|nr:hypothetical protein [Pseudomonadota bacterium]